MTPGRWASLRQEPRRRPTAHHGRVIRSHCGTGGPRDDLVDGVGLLSARTSPRSTCMKPTEEFRVQSPPHDLCALGVPDDLINALRARGASPLPRAVLSQPCLTARGKTTPRCRAPTGSGKTLASASRWSPRSKGRASSTGSCRPHRSWPSRSRGRWSRPRPSPSGCCHLRRRRSIRSTIPPGSPIVVATPGRPHRPPRAAPHRPVRRRGGRGRPRPTWASCPGPHPRPRAAQPPGQTLLCRPHPTAMSTAWCGTTSATPSATSWPRGGRTSTA